VRQLPPQLTKKPEKLFRPTRVATDARRCLQIRLRV